MSREARSRADRMLAAYGGRIRLWPEARGAGLLALLTSADFRRRLREEQALDRTLALAEPRLQADGRLERRLLATMGFASGPAQTALGARGFNLAGATALAAGCLVAGLLIGGQFGAEYYAETNFAGLTESGWNDVAAEIELSEDLG